MPFTATIYPASATGWTNSSSVCAVDGAEASAASAGPSSPTPSLVCSAFGLTGGGFAAITDLTITVKARMTLEGAMYVGLANNGAPIGAVKSAFVTFGEDTGSGFVGLEYTFNGWGFPISDYDLRNLSVFIYCASNPALPNTTPGQCYIEYVSAIAEYPAGDATPNAFSFGAAVGVPFNTEQTSATITLAGLSDAASVSVSNGLYEKNASGVWTATQGSAVNGDTFRVKHTSAGTGLTPKTTTLLIGGVSAGFTSTTEAADTTPDAFSLTAQTDVALSTPTVSNEITVAGINTAAAISVSGTGQYQINGGAWTSASGSVTAEQKVKVRITSSGSFGTLVSTTLTIGGVAATFNVTTRNSVGVPTAFDFVNQESVATSTLRTSNTITIAGLDAGVNVTVVNGEYSKNGGGWTTSATTCVNGDTFAVRHTSAAAGTQSVITTLVVGNFAESFCSTTAGADITPAAFSYTTTKDAAVGRYVIAGAATITGINVATPVNVVDGQVSINGAAYARYGSITTGQTLVVRIDPVYQAGATKVATVIVGGAQATFTATTTSNYYTAL